MSILTQLKQNHPFASSIGTKAAAIDYRTRMAVGHAAIPSVASSVSRPALRLSPAAPIANPFTRSK